MKPLLACPLREDQKNCPSWLPSSSLNPEGLHLNLPRPRLLTNRVPAIALPIAATLSLSAPPTPPSCNWNLCPQDEGRQYKKFLLGWGGVRVPSSSYHNQGPNDKLKFNSTDFHPEEPMTLLGSLMEQWLRVTERNGGGIKITTRENLYQAWWFSRGYANKIKSPPLVLTSLCAPAPPPGHMQLGRN